MPEVLRWRETFKELSTAWRTASAIDALNEVARWQDALTEMLATQTALRSEGLWIHGRSDLLGVVGYGRWELFHSAMLAWLLDPGRPHGLQDSFLKSFLALAQVDLEGLEYDSFSHVDVLCEYVGVRARTDVAVFGDGFTVAIEVKVDASEQDKQCERIYQDFLGMPNPTFVFLTPRGREPTTEGEGAAGSFVCVSFQQVHQVLKGALDEARVARYGGRDRPADSSLYAGLATCASYLRTLELEFS